ncbi:MAG: HD domain-containing phosphohydrolase [Solirubrobacteraceae bacterium]
MLRIRHRHAQRADLTRLSSVLDLAGELDSPAILRKACAAAEQALPGRRFLGLTGDGTVHGAAGREELGVVERRELERGAHPDLRHSAEMTARGERHGLLLALGGHARMRPQDRELVGIVAGHAGMALANGHLLARQEALARRDPLTGLLNHREFHETLAAELERCRRRGGAAAVSVVAFDLDRFKLINDTAGHAAGDRLLRSAAGALAGACRTSDHAFRVGGDEFALLLPDARPEQAGQVAERVRSAIASLHDELDVSFGIASWPEDGPTREGLLALADERLYAMKRSGSRPRPEPSPQERTARHAVRLRVASTLAGALSPLLDDGEIARVTVGELHRSFHYYLAVVQRLDPDGVLRVVSAAGPLTDDRSYLALEQHLDEGVNGRVARTGEPAVVPDTRDDPDYLRRDPRTDPGSELSFPIRVGGEIWGVLNLEEVATHAFDEADVLLADTVASLVGAALHRSALIGELEQAVARTLGVLSDALEASDRYTAEHGRAVADLALAAGKRLALEPSDLRALHYAAMLHDIGKIAIPSEILGKPGPLDPGEYELMKRHSEVGEQLLHDIPGFEHAALLVRGVHERWDGGGYPDGRFGDATPLGARIVAVCDAYHAMTSDRPYRAAMNEADAIAELRRHAGSQFDPGVVAAVTACLAGARAAVAVAG